MRVYHSSMAEEPRTVKSGASWAALFVFLAASAISAFTKTPSQSQSQPEKQTTEPPAKQESIVEVARKTKAQKEKSGSAKTYTNDDVTQLPKPGVTTSRPDPNRKREREDYEGSYPPKKGSKYFEQYWRNQFKNLQQQMDQINRQIASLREQIKQSGTAGFSATGVQRNMTIANDLSARLQAYENQKKQIQKQMDLLEDEGRKAGAEPGWFR